jgi:hypothetical protein
MCVISFLLLGACAETNPHTPADESAGEWGTDVAMGGGGTMLTDLIIVHTLFHPYTFPQSLYPYESDRVIIDAFLEIHLNCHIPSGVMPIASKTFALDNATIEEVYEIVRNAQTNVPINVELVNGEYIVIRTEVIDLRYAMITYAPTSDGWSGTGFNYMPMQGAFFDFDVFSHHFGQITDTENWAMYIPYHLFDDDSLFSVYKEGEYGGLRTNIELSHQVGHDYRIYSDITGFKEFYESLGLYEITVEGNTLILEGQIHRRNSSSVTADISTVGGRIILTFSEENEQRYVAYSIEVE